MEIAVAIKNLSVMLGDNFKALSDVSIELSAGKTIAIIGPSGAGKTTLMRAIVGRIKLKNGAIDIFGLPAGSPLLRHQLTYMTQELSVYSDLTVRENLAYFTTMAGVSRKQARAEIERVLRAVDLGNKANLLVGNLSGGQKQRVSLAIALIGKPKIMVLDEPTVGLDPVLRVKLWELFAELARNGTTLIISSHSMDEAEKCQDLVLIRDGKLISHSTPQELKARMGSPSIEICFLKLVGAYHHASS